MLELDSLNKRYGDTVALDGLGFEVGEGQVFGFVGPKGSGKTLAVVGTFIPPIAPMIVPGRAAQDALPAGELAVSLVLMVLFAAFMLWIAARSTTAPSFAWARR